MTANNKPVLTLVLFVFGNRRSWRVLHNATESLLGVVFPGVPLAADGNDVAVAVAEPPAPFTSFVAEDLKPGERLRCQQL